jgi:phosphopantetheine--protein transferase-like protein
MIAGLGLDIVHLPEFAERLEDPFFVNAVFTPDEQAACRTHAGRERQAHAFAGRFAAKEAFVKAHDMAARLRGVGTPIDDLREIEVLAAPDGPPALHLSTDLLAWLRHAGLGQPLLTISHDGPTAAAVVLLQGP